MDNISDDAITTYEISEVIQTRIRELDCGAPTFLTEQELFVSVSEIPDQSRVDQNKLLETDDGVYFKLSRSVDIAIREYNLGKCNLTVCRGIVEKDGKNIVEYIPVNNMIRPKLEYMRY